MIELEAHRAVSLQVLEERLLEGELGSVKPEYLWKVLDRTKNCDLAQKILDFGENEILDHLMSRYEGVPHDGELKKMREASAKDSIYRLKIMTKHPDARLDRRVRRKVGKLLAFVQGD